MCLAYLSLGQPGWPLLIAANRDEFHQRASARAAPWPGHPEIVAGRDLTAGGTWLGCTRRGRFAFLTNYREPGRAVPAGAPSRGVLVRDFLAGSEAPELYVARVAAHGQAWAGFNFIAGDPDGAWYFSNRDPSETVRRLYGRHVLSNHLLDTPWPKARRLQDSLDALAPAQWMDEPTAVFTLLRDTTPAAVQEMPHTGLPAQREALLSSPFVISPDYGTRCSTVLAVAADGRMLFSEQGYDAGGLIRERHDWRWQRRSWQPPH